MRLDGTQRKIVKVGGKASMILQQLLNGLVMGSYYVLIAIGLSIVFGILGISHFAHGSVVMVGGYVSYFLVTAAGLPFFGAMALSMICAAVLGILMERIAYRPVRNASPINAFIIALGLVMVMENLMTIIAGADQVIIKNNFNQVISIGGIHIASLRIFMLVISTGLVVLLFLFMKYTKLGKAVRATALNREASLIMGINTNLVIAVVFGLGSMLAAVAGTFVGALFAIYPTMSSFTVMKGFAVLILGGLGRLPGAIVGGLIIGLTESLGSMLFSSDFKDMFAFIIMMMVLMFRPNGLLGGKPA